MGQHAADRSTSKCRTEYGAAALRTDADEEGEADEAHAGLRHNHCAACPAAAADGAEAAGAISGRRAGGRSRDGVAGEERAN